ncbi:MAG: inositol monophosphatase family protein [Vampirovibrionales bacterium]|nr:inositol monophosphatase family protein [Vampirovibrionales bacterium]
MPSALDALYPDLPKTTAEGEAFESAFKLADSALRARLSLAESLARQAGQYQRAQLGQLRTISTKSSPVDLVTDVDQACDKLIREGLQAAFPDDGFLTEETANEVLWPEVLEACWVIDPLDGTTNYAHGVPHFAVSIAYCLNNAPVLGVIYDPMRDECFTALTGFGAYLNQQKLSVSSTSQLSESMLATGFPYDRKTARASNVPLFEQFMRHTRGVRRMGAAALDLAYVAAGRYDGLWEFRLAPWDIAAGMVLVQEAGGWVGAIHEKKTLELSRKQLHVLAANAPALRAQMQTILAENGAELLFESES